MNKVALVTGSAKRIGAVIARELHQDGMDVVLHYHHSKNAALALMKELNALRPSSAVVIQGDICQHKSYHQMIEQAQAAWGRLDVLVNNASSFYPTLIGYADEAQWEDLIGSNLKGPFFLSQAAAPYLREHDGTIVNIADIHADRPLKGYPIYSIAKAGLVMLTKALARELAPAIRVNAVAPGAILWPNDGNTLSADTEQHIINRTCLKRKGTPHDIAATVLFLIHQAYITGQVIAVDGGRGIRD